MYPSKERKRKREYKKYMEMGKIGKEEESRRKNKQKNCPIILGAV